MRTILGRLHLVVICFVGLGSAGCAPVFSEFQSARLVGEGNIEVTPAFTGVWYAEDADTEKVQNQAGVRVGIGVSPKVDFQATYVFISVDDDVSSTQVIALGPKFSVKEDRFAINVPIGFAVSDDFETSETWQVHPTLIFTRDMGDQNEISLATKALLYLNEDSRFEEIDLAAVLGIGVTNNRDRWMLRPEVGVLFDPGESGLFWTFGIGVGLKFQR